MITNLLLDVIKGLLSFIVSILPPFSIHLPSGVLNLCGWLLGFDSFLPVTESLTCLSILGTIVAVMATLKWSVKVVDLIAAVIP